jgi:membrane-bound lytic murein transglycosylase D
MLRPRARVLGVLCTLALLLSACAARVPATAVQQSVPTPEVAATPAVPAAPAPQPQPARDPIADLVAQSNAHAERAQRALADGHLETARAEFNAALEVLMLSPYGARSEPRLRAHFDRLVERASALEVMALAQADGFTEQRPEPATIDELLAIQPAETPAPTADTQQAVAEDLQATMHDIEIPLNKRVLSYVELFSGRLKPFLEDGLSRGAKYLPMIQEVFRAEGLPLDLAYVPLVESAFKPSALSRAKARGIWQFMRGTALENGLAHDWYIDERADPEKATYAAAKYLKTLHAMFNDWHLALASYNGGPGRVQRAMKRSGKTDFWALSASTRYLPRETRDYVPLILAAVIIAKNPAQYGLTVSPLESPASETVALASAVDLRRIAEWIGTPVQTLQELNPELRRWTTPVRASDYELKVPLGTADFVLAHMAETPGEDLAPLNRHTVKRGETLASIARMLKVSRVDLAEANYLKTNARLTAGEQLIVPSAPTLLLARRTDAPAPAVASRSIDAVNQAPAETLVAAAPKGTNGPPSQPERLVYRVKRGDTLSSIARLYQTSVSSLKQWNRLRTNTIAVGQRLTIFPQVNATN